VRIGDGVHTLAFWTLVAARPLRHPDEEALIRRESVERRKVLSLGGFLPRQKRQPGAAEIGQILSQRQLAVDFDVVDDGEAGILVGNAFGGSFEGLRVGLGPPVFQISVGVELPALIVEAVRQFMTDGCAGVAVVRRIIQLGIVERRLQDSGGKLMSFICGS
jgi:hypothetical protein